MNRLNKGFKLPGSNRRWRLNRDTDLLLISFLLWFFGIANVIVFVRAMIYNPESIMALLPKMTGLVSALFVAVV